MYIFIMFYVDLSFFLCDIQCVKSGFMVGQIFLII